MINDNDKSKKKKILEKYLRLMAVLVLKKYNPKVIGITGSLGKTTTKEAVYTVLSQNFKVRKNDKNYNNEIGLPLTIIGVEGGGSSVLGWLKVLLKWTVVILFPIEYPEILVLEMAADHPGDIQYLSDFVEPGIGIITNVSTSHLEFFKNVESIAKEKSYLVRRMNEKDLAILNSDNPYLAKIKNQLKCRTLTFGFLEEASVRATDIIYNYDNLAEGADIIRGISFKLSYKGTTIPMRLSNVLAEHNVYSALVATAVGLEMGLNLVEIGQAIENFSMPTGRMNLIKGIKNTVIIDDTYNASSPNSVIAALTVLGKINASRKIAVIGDMLELGITTEEAHREIAREFLKIKGGILMAVGERMKYAVEELEKHKTDLDRVYYFNNPMEAGLYLQEIMQKGDLILVKGSQGMRMEKIVEEVMAEPERAKELLCRQDEAWKNRPWKEV